MAKKLTNRQMEDIAGAVAEDTRTNHTLPDLIDCDLGLVSVPVKLRNSKTGKIENARLVELTGLQRDRYLNKSNARLKVDSKGKPTGALTTFENFQAELIVMCLERDGNEPFTLEEVQVFPSRVQKQLYEVAAKMNGLDSAKEDDDEEGED